MGESAINNWVCVTCDVTYACKVDARVGEPIFNDRRRRGRCGYCDREVVERIAGKVLLMAHGELALFKTERSYTVLTGERHLCRGLVVGDDLRLRCVRVVHQSYEEFCAALPAHAANYEFTSNNPPETWRERLVQEPKLLGTGEYMTEGVVCVDPADWRETLAVFTPNAHNGSEGIFFAAACWGVVRKFYDNRRRGALRVLKRLMVDGSVPSLVAASEAVESATVAHKIVEAPHSPEGQVWIETPKELLDVLKRDRAAIVKANNAFADAVLRNPAPHGVAPKGWAWAVRCLQERRNAEGSQLDERAIEALAIVLAGYERARWSR